MFREWKSRLQSGATTTHFEEASGHPQGLPRGIQPNIRQHQQSLAKGGADGDAVWTAFVVRRRRPILGAQSMPPNGLFDTGE